MTKNNDLPDFVQQFLGETRDIPLHLFVNSELAKRPKLKKYKIAKALNRSKGAVSHALAGDNKTLLFRIIRYIQRWDRQQSKTKSNTPVKFN